MTELQVWTTKLRKLNPNVSKAKGDVILRPAKAHLAWHRSNVFQQ
ncbi:MAG: hypothetical protein WCO94_11045 [Verrucomicrobiota bacterium]